MAAVQLELFTKLSGGKQVTLDELQKVLGMEARPAGVFASALESLGLLQVTKKEGEEGSEGLFANSPVSEIFLDKSKDSYMGDIITMFDKRLYKAWNKLVESLQTNKSVNAADGGDAESIFDQAKSKQAVEEIQKFTHAMYGVSIGPALLYNCQSVRLLQAL
jgi:hypothetical protein